MRLVICNNELLTCQQDLACPKVAFTFHAACAQDDGHDGNVISGHIVPQWCLSQLLFCFDWDCLARVGSGEVPR